MNKFYKPLLSVIIPTKNRYETLLPIINQILSTIDNSDLEIIIQDNSLNNSEIIEFVNNSKDIRIKYFYTKEHISITENTKKAIENSNGKYLIFIGDDDFISPYIFKYIGLMQQNEIKCLIYNPGYYWWGNVDFSKKSYYHRNFALWLPKEKDDKFIRLYSESELNNMLKKGASNYFKLPRLYHGIVEKEILERIKIQTGTYLPGTCPDIAFATAIALTINEYYYVNYPISIFGASRNSGGGWSVSNKHNGKIEDQNWLPEDLIEKWNENIPKIWSECTIYPQTVSEILHTYKSDKKINFLSFYATMLTREKFLNHLTLPQVHKYCNYNIFKYIALLYLFIKKIIGKYIREFKIITRQYGYNVLIVSTPEEVMSELKKI